MEIILPSEKLTGIIFTNIWHTLQKISAEKKD